MLNYEYNKKIKALEFEKDQLKETIKELKEENEKLDSSRDYYKSKADDLKKKLDAKSKSNK